MKYELHYCPSIAGHSEFVRLALEEVGAVYVDKAKDSAGETVAVEKLQQAMCDDTSVTPPFAPPFLKAGTLVIAQTANILLYLGVHHGLASEDEAGRLWVHQLQLTLTDWVVEIHDTHYPFGAVVVLRGPEDRGQAAGRGFSRRAFAEGYGLFRDRLNRIRAKCADTSAAWINSIFLVMNLLILLKIFFALGKKGLMVAVLHVWKRLFHYRQAHPTAVGILC